MNTINISKLKKTLKALKADASVSEIAILNAEMHNELIEQINNGKKINMYILLQLRIQIAKNLMELKKFNKKLGDESEDIESFISGLKGKKEVR